ncbi:hypothetical protein Glove_196g89 [Diversispora epigaea]|uniref:BTB domain-containing protein n=1 Tax=Diversispora epigaea TaxID=1348612 RepID=A0A397IVB3_9GLOM|nr:hypothetical protein Glove_196g89 [Diversispora epigaea]
MVNDKDDYNVIIEVKNKKSFTAHSNVLKCRSPYFCKEFKNIIPNENNIKTITKLNISDEIFDIILKYIYGGIVDLENVETKFIFDLMITANEFEIEELTKKLENHLIETKSSWLKSHFSLVYCLIFNGNNFEDLKNYCNDIVAKYPSLIFDAEDFTSLQESALVSLLKRDDLQLEEVIIWVWEYIIKWGIAQNSTLPVDLTEWNNENFTTLKTILQQCLPLIRYFYIPGTDVLDKLKPYKKILDKQLWEDLKQYLIAPDKPVKLIILLSRTILVQELLARTTEQANTLSTIITCEHVAEISSWIDRKSIKGTDEILGGYNPLSWITDPISSWGVTNDSFIFSLKNCNIQNSILSRVKIREKAIVNVGTELQHTYSPHFGWDLFMFSSSSNFTLDNKSVCKNSNIHYEKPIRTTTTNMFSIVDYEVFKVIKKTS